MAAGIKEKGASLTGKTRSHLVRILFVPIFILLILATPPVTPQRERGDLKAMKKAKKAAPKKKTAKKK